MCSFCSGSKIRSCSGSSSAMQSSVAPGGIEREQETCRDHVTYMQSPCDLLRPEERVMWEVSSLRFKGCPCDTWCRAVTRQADCTSDAWKTAGRVRKWQWQRCVVLFPAALTPALWACPTTEPNHFRQTWAGGTGIDCTFKLLLYPVVDKGKDLEEPVFEMCVHSKSQQATCFSILYLFYFTGLCATSQLD